MALALSSSPLVVSAARCGAARSHHHRRAGASSAQHKSTSKSFVVAKRCGAVKLPTSAPHGRAGTHALRLPAARAASSSSLAADAAASAAADVEDDAVVTPEVVLGMDVEEEKEQGLMKVAGDCGFPKMGGFGGVGSLAAAAGVLALGGLLALPPSALAEVADAAAPLADAAAEVAGDGSLTDGFLSAFLLIFFSEIGDKTFFIAVLLVGGLYKLIQFTHSLPCMPALSGLYLG
jgi:hypothetical protein